MTSIERDDLRRKIAGFVRGLDRIGRSDLEHFTGASSRDVIRALRELGWHAAERSTPAWGPPSRIYRPHRKA